MSEGIYDQGLTESQRRKIRFGWQSYKETVGMEARTPVVNCGRGVRFSGEACYQKYLEERAIIVGAVDVGRSDLQIDNLLKNFRRRG